jgi:hypothetical protein
MSTDYLLRDQIHLPSMSDPDKRDPMQINKHLQVTKFRKNLILY